MKRAIAGILTVMLMGLFLWSSRRPPDRSADGPRGDVNLAGDAPSESLIVVGSPVHPAESRIRALLKAASQGDVATYLAGFRGPLRDRLDREIRERGEESFAGDLRQAAQARKSHAIFSARVGDDGVAAVTVESVYADRNERQDYRLELADGLWRVVSVDTVKSREPQAKLGDMATFEAPEGIPVQKSPLPPGPDMRNKETQQP